MTRFFRCWNQDCELVSQLSIHLYTTVSAANTTSNPKVFQKNYTTPFCVRCNKLPECTFAALLAALCRPSLKEVVRQLSPPMRCLPLLCSSSVLMNGKYKKSLSFLEKRIYNKATTNCFLCPHMDYISLPPACGTKSCFSSCLCQITRFFPKNTLFGEIHMRYSRSYL